MQPQNPSVGRIVHYVLPEGGPWAGQHRPAIVTQVWAKLDNEQNPGMSNLIVFKAQTQDGGNRDSDTFFVGSVSYDETGKPGTWHWPERE